MNTEVAGRIPLSEEQLEAIADENERLSKLATNLAREIEKKDATIDALRDGWRNTTLKLVEFHHRYDARLTNIEKALDHLNNFTCGLPRLEDLDELRRRIDSISFNTPL